MPLQIDLARADPELWATEGVYALVLVRNGILSPNFSDDYYIFTPPPQSLEAQLEPGTFIQPTQGSQFYVEGLGLQSKVVTIGGTSGVFGARSPFDQSQVFPPVLSRSTGLADSGYSLFHKLQRLYETYQKEVGEGSGILGGVISRVEMHFFNLKDGEFYHVEPLNFRVSRSVGKPLQYQYSLSLRVLRSSQFGQLAATIFGVFQTLQTIVHYEKMASLAFLLPAIAHDVGVTFSNLTNSFTDVLGRLDRDLARLIEVGNGLKAVASVDTVDEFAQGAASAVTGGLSGSVALSDARRRVEQMLENSQTGKQLRSPLVSGGAEDVLRFIPTGARTQDVLETLWALTPAVSVEFLASRAITPSPRVDYVDPAYFVYGETLEAEIDSYLAIANAPVIEDSLADGPADFFIFGHELARRGEGSLPAGSAQNMASIASATNSNRGTSGDRPLGAAGLGAISHWADLVNSQVPSGITAFLQKLGVTDPRTYSGLFRRVQVDATDDIRSFAQRTLGDWRRWIEVAVLNDLRWPYFSLDGTAGTAKIGDSILIPTDDSIVGRDQLENLERAARKFDRLSIKDIFLGLDFQVSAEGDLVIDARGAFAFVAGGEAFAQNLEARLSTVFGTFLPHSAYGLGVVVGDKVSGLQIQVWRGMLTGAVRSDSRVAEVQRMTVTLAGDTITYDVRVLLRQVDEAVTVRGFF